MSAKSCFNFRAAKIVDIEAVRAMIQELADFEQMSTGPELSKEELIRDAGLSGGPEYCHIYVLDYTTNENTQIIGYAICFYSYSTWQGKAYFLEDIFMRQSYRGIGAGAYMFRAVAAEAVKRDCKRLAFNVLSWNPARTFYEHLGATDITVQEDWHLYRISGEALTKLATSKSA